MKTRKILSLILALLFYATNVLASGTSGGGSGTTNADDLASGTVGAARGGTNIDTSASTGVPYVDNGTWGVDNQATFVQRFSGCEDNTDLLSGDGTCVAAGSGDMTKAVYDAGDDGQIDNAALADALGANGANCSAGNAPLGVDASGAVESCFSVLAPDGDGSSLTGITSGQVSGLGTMATQNKGAVDIDGGTIDNTPIGATTPSTGVFTTLTFDEAVSTCVPADNNCGAVATNVGSPAGANLSAGLQWFDNTTQCFMIRNNDNTANITMSCLTKSFTFGIDNVVAASDNNIFIWNDLPRAITVTKVSCTASTDNVIGVLSECTAGDITSCTNVDDTDWTIGGETAATVGTTYDSGFENPGIAAGAYLKWITTSVGTTNSNKLSCTMRYTE